ncbi:MAG TPA: hypothetical protein VJS88_02400, partial [Chthoniobacterales bacterium]|nr:hypothetical protein [Chthoniobacterales bacterium]
YGYHDEDEIQRTLEAAGFREIRIEVVSKASVSTDARDAATGLVQGSPMAVAITERDASLFPAIIDAVTEALKKELGGSPSRAPMRAIVIEARA